MPFVSDPQNELVWSMEEVFDAMADAVREGAQVRAMFDSDFGYAREVYVDGESDESGWMLEVSEFKVVGR